MQQFNVERRIRQRKKQEKEESKQKTGTRRKSHVHKSKKTTTRKAALDNLAKKNVQTIAPECRTLLQKSFLLEEDDDDDEDYEYGGTLKRMRN